jgi:hypothetical protein
MEGRPIWNLEETRKKKRLRSEKMKMKMKISLIIK